MKGKCIKQLSDTQRVNNLSDCSGKNNSQSNMDGLPAGYRLQPKYTPEEIRQRRIAREQNAAAVGVQAEPAAPRARDGDDDPGPDDDPENRLRGIWWCVCENCREVPKNPSVRMCVCCQEQNFTGLTEKLEQPEIKCITLHADFDAMCKTEAVLEMMLAMSREKRGYLVNDNWTNR